MREIVLGGPMKEKPNAHFSFGKRAMPKVESGEEITVIVTGKITGFNDQPWGKSFDIQITKIKTDAEESGSLTKDIKNLSEKRKK